jgi:hypothetical protein
VCHMSHRLPEHFQNTTVFSFQNAQQSNVLSTVPGVPVPTRHRSYPGSTQVLVLLTPDYHTGIMLAVTQYEKSLLSVS